MADDSIVKEVITRERMMTGKAVVNLQTTIHNTAIDISMGPLYTGKRKESSCECNFAVECLGEKVSKVSFRKKKQKKIYNFF